MRVVEPRDDCYVVPKSYPSERMHYAIVQVSQYRHVVVEYRGSTMQSQETRRFPSFEVVSKPMSYTKACEYAAELTSKRTKP